MAVRIERKKKKKKKRKPFGWAVKPSFMNVGQAFKKPFYHARGQTMGVNKLRAWIIDREG